MIADLLIFILGGSVGFFAAALCKAAGRADERIEQLQMDPHTLNTVDNIIEMKALHSSEENIKE